MTKQPPHPGLTQQVLSVLQGAQVLEQGSEAGQQGGGGVGEELGHPSGLGSALWSQRHRQVLLRHLQVHRRRLKEGPQRRPERLRGGLHQGSRTEQGQRLLGNPRQMMSLVTQTTIFYLNTGKHSHTGPKGFLCRCIDSKWLDTHDPGAELHFQDSH